ncbi:transmembrane protein, putative [Medicago truncatula]|uniref:Transmembrane protein, putative n=1 Tax=Medicago truncatula TaxID=3880 RepID=A0A072UG32_MEDTR|nr:transmembrane protein, putative [Medicago truncatula]
MHYCSHFKVIFCCIVVFIVFSRANLIIHNSRKTKENVTVTVRFWPFKLAYLFIILEWKISPITYLRVPPSRCGDENGETIIDERKIRIKPLPKKCVSRSPDAAVDIPVSDISLVRKNSSNLDSFLDPAFMSLIKGVWNSGRKLLQHKEALIVLNYFDMATLTGLRCLLPKNILFTLDTYQKQTL